MGPSNALLYGLIQGLGEFLPISSSGHLALLPRFLEIKDPGVPFDLAMHVGTALAVTLYFKKDFISLLQKSSRKMVTNIFWATSSTVVIALCLHHFAASYGRSINVIAINLIVFGIIMAITDIVSRSSKVNFYKVQSKKSVLIGIAQGIAIFPGVSRSGATLSMARILNISRKDAAKFSFLLSVPIIILGIIKMTPELLQGTHNYTVSDLIIGMVSSFFIGLATIHLFLKFITKIGLIPFAIYRIILGTFLLLF